MRFLALGGACELAVKLTPDKVAQYAPGWLMSGLSSVAIICTVLAGVARVTVKDGASDVRPSDPQPDSH
jgi:hypothetical protein